MIPASQVILLVEDSEADAYAVRRAFQDSNLRNSLVHVRDGNEALDYLFRRGVYAGGEQWAGPAGLVLLDLNLPGLNGAEVLEHIRRQPETKAVPVVVLTTSDAPDDVNRCYEIGANSYVKKPVKVDDFLEALTRLRSYWLELVILPGV